MLKRFQVKGFRSCKDVTIDDLGSMTALVGRNGSGKTNILRAIEWLAQTATVSGALLERNGRMLELPQSITADIEQDGVLYRYTFATRLEQYSPKDDPVGFLLVLQESLAVRTENQKWEKVLDREGGTVRFPGAGRRSSSIRIGHLIPCLPALAALLPTDDDLLRHIRPVLAFLSATRYYPVDETNVVSGIDAQQVVSAAEYRAWQARYQATKSPGTSVLMRLLHAYLERKPQFVEIQALLGPNGLNLIDKILVTSFRIPNPNGREAPAVGDSKHYKLRFRPGLMLGKGPDPLNFDQLSLGTRRLLHILVSLTMDDSTLLLIEHPEDSVHYALLTKLISLLRTNTDPAQVILTSHSPEVFNMLAPPDVRLVTIHKGATRVRSLTAKEVDLATRFIREEGSFADFLTSVREE